MEPLAPVVPVRRPGTLGGLTLAILVASGPGIAGAHFCGDGETNQAIEECDTPDDTVCPGLCSTTCKCAVCGDGVLDDPAEDCDIGNDFSCPGTCLPTCACPTCGNGVVEFPERCDGTDDGACPDQCSQECRCPSPCGAQPDPASSCRQALGNTLLVRDRADDTADRLRWKWANGAATTLADFLNPVAGATARYGICLYDGALQPLIDTEVSPAGDCAGVPCWRPTSNGYTYKDATAGQNGITSLKLQGGATGSAKIDLKAKGSTLNTPRPRLRLPVVVELVIDEGGTRSCWQSTFDAAAVNETGRFLAKQP